MGRLLNCPQCRHERVLRSRPLSASERVAAIFLLSPFSCPQCSCRFLASRIGLDSPRHPVDRREHLRIPVRLYLSFPAARSAARGRCSISRWAAVSSRARLTCGSMIFFTWKSRQGLTSRRSRWPQWCAQSVSAVSPSSSCVQLRTTNGCWLSFRAQAADHLQKSAAAAVPAKG